MKKKMMTKVLAVLALSSTAFIFAGCGKKKETTTKPADDGIKKVDGFSFKAFNGEAEIVGIDKKGAELVIPSTLDGNKVVRMSCTYTDTELTKVTIPDSLTYLTGNGFMGCTNLSQVEFQGTPSLAIIPSKAFQGTKLTSITIPASVKSISYQAFQDIDTLTSITFENGSSLESIGPFAFSDCDSITTINLPSNLVTISDSAFQSCDGLTNLSFANTSKLETIEQYAFTECVGLTELDFSSSTSLKTIGDNAFRGCSNLSSLIFDEALTTIGDQAFYSTKNISSICLPKNVTSIGEEAFVNAGLTSIEIQSSSDVIIESNAFTQYDLIGSTLKPKEDQIKTLTINGNLSLSKVFTGYATQVRKSLTTVRVTGTKIAADSFVDCININSLTIDDTIKSIGDGAFERCTSITTVDLSNNVIDTISEGSFADCINLENLSLPSTVKYVKNYAFDGCEKVSNIDLSNLIEIGSYAFRNTGISKDADGTSAFSDEIKTIGEYAFDGCSGIKEVIIATKANVVTSIKQYAFTNCPNIKNIVLSTNTVMESNVFVNDTNVENLTTRGKYGLATLFGTSKEAVATKIKTITILEETGEANLQIEAGAFAGCLLVTTINIPSNITKIGSEAFRGCKSISTLTLPAGVTKIGSYAFADCDSLTISSLPSNVSEIAEGLFKNDTSITTFTINDSVTSIGDSAFEGCSNITISSLNDNIKAIGDYAFSGCVALSLAVLPTNIEVIGDYAFSGCLLVSVSETVSSLNEIGDYAFAGCKGIKSFEFVKDLDSNSSNTYLGESILEGCTMVDELKIYGSTPLSKLFGESVDSLKPVLTKVTINAGSTEITDDMFNGFIAIKDVNIANTVTKIGKNAFNGCESLIEADLTNITEIGDGAYAGSALPTITIPAHEITLGEGVFEGCKSLYEVNFANGTEIKTIPAKTFKDTILIGITIPDSVEEIGDSAFSGILTLNYATFGDDSSLTSIGIKAFEKCMNIHEIVIPAGVNTIGNSAFSTCKALQKVDFKADDLLETIEKYTFLNCYALTIINLPNSIRTIDEYAFSCCNCITDIDLPDSLEKLGIHVFENSLSINNIIIPVKVEEIPAYAFNGCKLLKTINWQDYNKVKVIGDYAFYHTQYSSIIPATVTTIGSYAFATNKTDTGEPRTFANVEDLAIGNGAGLVIGDNAFEKSAIKSVIFGSKVSGLGKALFKDSLIESVDFTNIKISLINDSMFENCDKLETVTLGSSSTINTIGAFAFNKCIALRVFDFSKILSIGAQSFEGCDVLLIEDNESVVLSLGVNNNVTIGYKAFNSSGIRRLVLGSKIVSIGGEAFSMCSNLKVADLSLFNVTMISDSFFADCALLSSVTINENIRTIGTNAFKGTAITNLEFLEDATELEKIMDSAFNSCVSLEEAKIPDTVTYVGGAAFKDCSSLNKVTWSAKANIINASTFQGSSAITEFTVPAKVGHIDANVFEMGSELTITFLGTIPPSVDEKFIANTSGLSIIVPSGCKEKYILVSGFVNLADKISEQTGD